VDRTLSKILNEEELETLLAYAENDMNVLRTAKEGFLHYNTVKYRLKRIKEKTGLDPHRFYDLMKLVQMAEKENGSL
jgi:carbohydrate diacid regulator